ncbi:MAG: D-alanine--D-alanine ligase family protein [Spirochaetota bacterium]
MQRVVFLYGGKSGEHEVSLRSAASILAHLDATRFEAVLVGIGKDGVWRLQEGGPISHDALKPLRMGPGPRVLVLPSGGLAVERKEGLELLPCECVFPVLHGSYGEDGTIQGLLECADLPYVGAPVMGSALGMDKEKAKLLWIQAGLPVVPFMTVRRADLGNADPEGAVRRIAGEVTTRFGWPAFAKPACAGSSVGASKVSDARDLKRALAAALEWDDKALIEPFVEGREIECSVLGNGKARAFPPGEIVPSHEFYDYEAKYIDPDGARFFIPANFEPSVSESIMSIAVKAFDALDLAGMARVDFFIRRNTAELLLNEVNTIPGFTSISMYPKMCESGGLPYGELVTELVELALERHKGKKQLRYSF